MYRKIGGIRNITIVSTLLGGMAIYNYVKANRVCKYIKIAYKCTEHLDSQAVLTTCTKQSDDQEAIWIEHTIQLVTKRGLD